jgi:hypothetical protein
VVADYLRNRTLSHISRLGRFGGTKAAPPRRRYFRYEEEFHVVFASSYQLQGELGDERYGSDKSASIDLGSCSNVTPLVHSS